MYIYIYIYIYITYNIYNIYNIIIYISVNVHLVGKVFSLLRYWFRIMCRVFKTIFTFWILCKWISYRSDLFLQRTWRNYNIYHLFCDTPCHLLFFGLRHHIFSTTRSILSLNINTTSSQLLELTYYKRAILEQTLNIFNKTSLFPVTSL